MNLSISNDKDTIIVLLEDSYSGRTNNLTRSIEITETALAISRSIDNKALIGRSLNQLSLYYMIMGDYKKSTNHSEEAIICCDSIGDEKGIADAKYNIAGVHYKSDNFQLGLVYLIDALKIYQKFNDWHNISRVEKSLGTIYEYIGDQNNAINSYEEAIKAAKIIGDLNLESNAYNNLSGILLKQNKPERAMTMIENSIAMKKQTNDTRGYAFAIYGRGKIRSSIGQYLDAEADFLKAIKIHREMGEKLGLGMVLNKLGDLYLKLGDLDKAKEIATEGLNFSTKHNIVIVKYKCDYLLYKIFKKGNKHLIALEYFERYLKEREAVINTQTLKIIENYDMIIKMKTLENETKLQKEKAEIIEKKNLAEESARLKQKFLSTMSHEIRTPLNAITTIISLLENKENDDENKKLLESLQFSSNNLIRIINDILDFTKLDEAKDYLDLQPTNFRLLCDKVSNTYKSMAKEKGLDFQLKINKSAEKTYLLDETKFAQIVGNLINNAIKYTDKGFITFEVNPIKEENEYDVLQFKIADTGEGISEDDFKEIFESFSQIKPVLTRKHGGTGLGLAIVKKILELHDSKIEVKSELGKGSEFYFELKLKKAISIIPIKKEYTNELNGKLAMLAEDTPINAMLMIKLLSNWGVITEHVQNGKLALEKAKQKKFDFILMDIHMPEMNGLEATKHIRTEKNPNMETPIFAVTADILSKNDTEYSSYFNDFLWKPLEIEKLFDALTEAK